MGKIRSTLVTAAAIGSAAIGGAAIADAATPSTTTSSTRTPSTSAPPAGAPRGAPGSGPSQGTHTVGGKTEKPLTGDVATKVRAAALAKVPGTVDRVETNVDDNAPYEAHITKSDGSQVVVEVNSDYTVYAVKTMGGHP